tara:strand:- start:835 stop:1005 length:171 start_codon:yes stop_codon:yes gene_type:complete
MIELIKHTLGICGEHWHPNVITLLAGSPIFLTAVHYIKCKCGGWLKHKKDCNNSNI